MEETRLAEIEERLGWRSADWWRNLGDEGSPDHCISYLEVACEQLLAEVRRLQEAGVVLTQHVAGCAAEGCSCRKNWAIAQFRKAAR